MFFLSKSNFTDFGKLFTEKKDSVYLYIIYNLWQILYINMYIYVCKFHNNYF